jgi:RNA polymerase subunit RPABC4/transcription elongation factor Spt4
MQQKNICKRCGAANQEGLFYCTSCGEKLASVCPSCGKNLPAGLNFCPYCGSRLSEEKEPETASGDTPSKNMKEMLHDLHMIAVFKEGLPGDQQDWCNTLGLHVQYRELDRYTHGIEGVWVKAGSKYRTHLEGWTDNKKIFEITKYNPGNWEALIKPTLEIAKWLYDHGGLKVEDRDAFKKSIDAFRKTGNLQLPV